MKKVYATEIDKDGADLMPLCGVYLHGKLDGLYKCSDFVWIKEGKCVLPEKDGFEVVEVIYPDGSSIRAFMYYWHTLTKVEPYSRFDGDFLPILQKTNTQRGLICACDDIEANRYAIEKFNSRAEYL